MTAEQFLDELERLILYFPHRPSTILHSENSPYGANMYYVKNVYYGFDSGNSENCNYIYDCWHISNSMDCTNCFENTEACYECVDAHACFNSHFLQECTNTRDSAYSYKCFGCSNVFGCAYLKNKSYCIFNRQLTPEEYHQTITKLQQKHPEDILVELQKLKKRYPVTQTSGDNNENSIYGNYMYHCKNCYMCFDCTKNENCMYMYDSGRSKYSMDFSQSGDSELSYETIDSAEMFNCNYCMFSKTCQDSAYLIDCTGVKKSLGCINLHYREYCILNRQFSASEYQKISSEIISDLKDKNLGWRNLII